MLNCHVAFYILASFCLSLLLRVISQSVSGLLEKDISHVATVETAALGKGSTNLTPEVLLAKSNGDFLLGIYAVTLLGLGSIVQGASESM